MEVFLRSMPPDVTESNLRSELARYIDVLGIKGWTCNKAKKKDLAWIQFKTLSDGKTFLARHGAITAVPAVSVPTPKQALAGTQPPTRPKQRSRLHLFNTPVFAQQSN